MSDKYFVTLLIKNARDNIYYENLLVDEHPVDWLAKSILERSDEYFTILFYAPISDEQYMAYEDLIA